MADISTAIYNDAFREGYAIGLKETLEAYLKECIF